MEKGQRPKGLGKGPQFERSTARALSLWWTCGVDEDAIVRTISSGAKFTNRKRKDQSLVCSEAGDLKSAKPSTERFLSYFLIELKRGRTTEINLTDHLDSLDSAKSPFLELVWKKSIEEMEACNRQEVMIIFKRNRKKDVVMLSDDSILLFNKVSPSWLTFPSIRITKEGCGFVFVLFEDLILNCEPW